MHRRVEDDAVAPKAHGELSRARPPRDPAPKERAVRRQQARRQTRVTEQLRKQDEPARTHGVKEVPQRRHHFRRGVRQLAEALALVRTEATQRKERVARRLILHLGEHLFARDRKHLRRCAALRVTAEPCKVRHERGARARQLTVRATSKCVDETLRGEKVLHGAQRKERNAHARKLQHSPHRTGE